MKSPCLVMVGLNLGDLDKVIERMKTEIMTDVEGGRVPRTVRRFSDLFDFVDGWWYGGFQEDLDWVPETEEGVMFRAAATAVIDQWLLEGGLEHRH